MRLEFWKHQYYDETGLQAPHMLPCLVFSTWVHSELNVNSEMFINVTGDKPQTT